MIEYLIKSLLVLLLLLPLTYILLNYLFKRHIVKLSGRNIKVEELVPLSREVFIASLRIREKRFFIIFGPNFVKVLHEESITDNPS
ncbi:hypothetical protein JCM9492_12310 [Aquifex pyrophilus]